MLKETRLSTGRARETCAVAASEACRMSLPSYGSVGLRVWLVCGERLVRAAAWSLRGHRLRAHAVQPGVGGGCAGASDCGNATRFLSAPCSVAHSSDGAGPARESAVATAGRLSHDWVSLASRRDPNNASRQPLLCRERVLSDAGGLATRLRATAERGTFCALRGVMQHRPSVAPAPFQRRPCRHSLRARR